MKPKNKKGYSKELIERLYIKERKSINKIAKELKCAEVTAWRYLKRYKIKLRENKGGVWTKERREYISKLAKERMLGNKNPQKPLDYEYSGKVVAISRKKELVGDKCQFCEWDDAPCDGHHLKSIKDGGKHKIDNIIILCPNCHRLLHYEKLKKEEIIDGN